MRTMLLSEFASWAIDSQESQFCRVEIEKDSNIITFFERGSLWAYLENDLYLDPTLKDAEKIHYSTQAYVDVSRSNPRPLTNSKLVLTEDLVDRLPPKVAAKLVTMTLRLTMPIFIARQWFKHQIGFARNEISRRYVDAKPRFHIPDSWRKRALDKKQGSSEEILPKGPGILLDTIGDNNTSSYYNYYDLLELAGWLYEAAIRDGYCPEQARMILPQSMLTDFMETASLASYARLYKLRTSSDAQKEIRDMAKLLGEIIDAEYPKIWRKLV